jgi:hypothetical protein
MFGRKIFLLVTALAFWRFPVEASPVHINLEWPSSTPTSVRASAHIRAVQTAGPNAGAVPVEAKAGLKGTELNLSEGVWQVQASAPGYWSQSGEVMISAEAPSEINLTFWPAASLYGEIVTAGAATLPGSIDIDLTAASRSVSETTIKPLAQPVSSPSRAELHCEITAGAWSCLGPAGVFDMRLEVPGYAPRYEWEVSLKPEQIANFGRTELLRTSSVFGRAIARDGSNPQGPCRATLRLDMERRGPPDSDQGSQNGPSGKISFPVSLNRRGYFQVVGISPGRYALAVACQGGSSFRDLRVQADTETRIDPPLVLENLTLDVSVLPKTDPAGQPWKLAVYETAPHYLLIADGVATSADGRWIRRGLMAGNYHVIIRSSDGTAWLQKYFDVDKASGPLLLHMSSANVAGRVTMSSQPVSARLVFTNNAGGESATLFSDDTGHFHGLLPIAPGMQESSWTVEAHVAQPPLTQHLLDVSVQATNSGAAAWLDLQLPAILVRGTVLSADGKPQRQVEVVFEGSDGIRTSTGTDDAGRFEMLDLPPGKYTAMANSPDGASDRVPFKVAEGGGSELNLVLSPFNRYAFYVISNRGPVANAVVQVWIAPGVPRAFVRTDEDGRFDVTLPPGTSEVGLTVGAPGYALKLTRMRVPDPDDESRGDSNTISLDDAGGTLVLNFHPPGQAPDESASLYLVHNGAIQDALTVAGWGTNQAGANTTGPTTVEAIEPGDYALCGVDPTEVTVLWSGALPSDRCRKGSLEQEETLTLSPQ